MLLWNIIEASIKSLTARKMRSFLAMLGIIIGVAAVISMLALGSGARKQVIDRFQSMGANLLLVMPGQSRFHGVTSGTEQNLKIEDAEAIVRQVKGISMVAPAVQKSCQLKYFNKNTRTSVYGTTPTYFKIRDYKIKKGRFFTDAEVDRGARYAVIGPSTAEELFGLNEPIGETIKVNGRSFIIIGVLEAKGAGGFMNPDDRLFISYNIAMKQLIGTQALNEIDVQVKDTESIESVQNQITELLRKRHRIMPGAPDDFRIGNMDEMRKSASEMVNLFRALLGSIAAISLIVGGIGIMNIMLVSVTERTREIGVRKAIGAKEKHILIQFLLESMIVSGFGGLIGVALGLGAARLVPKFLQNLPAVVELPSVLFAMLFSVAVGIFFGFWPAWRAARLDPIEALRYE